MYNMCVYLSDGKEMEVENQVTAVEMTNVCTYLWYTSDDPVAGVTVASGCRLYMGRDRPRSARPRGALTTRGPPWPARQLPGAAGARQKHWAGRGANRHQEDGTGPELGGILGTLK